MTFSVGRVCDLIGIKEQVALGVSGAEISLFQNIDRRLFFGFATLLRVRLCYEWNRKREYMKQERQLEIYAEIVRG